jgi:hypothetical protein
MILGRPNGVQEPALSETIDLAISNRLGLLSKIERTFDVWSWDFQGLRYWPLVRSALRTALMRPITAGITSEGSSPSPSGRPAGPVKTMTADEIRSSWAARFAALPRSVDVLFLSRVEDNHDVVAGQAHDRMIDPIYRLAVKRGYIAAKLRVHRSASAPSAQLAVAAPAFGPDEGMDLDLKMPSLPELDRMLDWIASTGAALDLKSSVLRSLIKRILHREIVFGALLDHCRPRAVFLGVFDDPMQMAAVLACRRRGVLVIDVQHGKQGSDHLLCTTWENIPPSGSELLPDRFWVWGEATARRVSAALGPAAETHRPMIGGNVWLAEWQRGVHGGVDAARSFAARSADASRRLLVCLQPIADPVPPPLRDAMAASPADWVWWVRLHRKQATQRDEIAALVAATGARFELGEPTALPLYPLIMASDCHLTGWSTVAFEAEAYGVPTVLFHPQAESIFESEIAEGRFYFARDGESVLAAIAAAKDSARHDLPPYISTDAAVAGRLLEDMLGSGALTRLLLRLARDWRFFARRILSRWAPFLR